jgi:ribonuclease BN (tRNA processing enzyme)
MQIHCAPPAVYNVQYVRNYAILLSQEAQDTIMKITILGAHNTESLHTRYMSLLIDDVLVMDAGGLTSSLTFRDQMKIKAVLLTHAHYDHIRDIPALAMNFFLRLKSVDIYTHQPVLDNLTQYLLNGKLYAEFHKKPAENPTLRLHVLEPFRKIMVEGYEVLPCPVNHAIPTMGYQLTSRDGKTIFYSGDTGPNSAELWQQIAPQVLFIELTTSNRWEEAVKHNGHLTPNLLNQELLAFKKIRGYLPQVIAVHLNPQDEPEIRPEIAAVAGSLGVSIRLAREGMVVEI